MSARRPSDRGGSYLPVPLAPSELSSTELQDLNTTTGTSNTPRPPEPSSPPPKTAKPRCVGHDTSSLFSSYWKYVGPLLLWLIFVAVTIVCWVFHSRLRDSPTEFGLRTRWTAECDKLPNPFQSWRQVALLTVNAVAGIVTGIASYFRTRLLAPTDDNTPIDSFSGFWHVGILLKLLYIVLLLSPLPVYFLSNTLFFVTFPAYNSYEMVVSTSFFAGAPFNLSCVDITRYDLNEAPTMPPLNLLWPDDYGGVDRLNDSLVRLQQEPGLWKNLSRGDCVNEFNAPRYTRYRTVLLVTDFGQPQGLPANNNSVLAAGVLAGGIVPQHLSQSVPARHSSKHDPNPIHAPRRIVRRARRFQTVYWDTMPGRDLCYQYWTDEERWAHKSEGTFYLVPRADLKYCVAEPAKTTRLCEAVYSPKVLFVLAITLAVMLGAISVALLLQLLKKAGYSSESLPDIDWDSYGSGHWYGQTRTPWQLEFLNFLILIYVWVLWAKAKQPDRNKLFATNSRYDGWLIDARALYNALHVLYEVLFFFQVNNLQKRALSVNGTPTSAGHIFLPLRSFLVHFIYGLIFITELQVVMPLGMGSQNEVGTAGTGKA